jgi:comEA protein
MKRKLFFFLEKLQISKSERIAVSVLSLMVIITGAITLAWSPKPEYSESEYEKLEQIFKEKSRELEQERDMIMARYEPLDIEIDGAKPVEPDEFDRASSDTIRPPADQEKSKPAGSLININSATAEELLELPGIGPAYSKRIIDWRNKNGRFSSVDQLLEIKGIGEKRLASIKPLITL